MGEIWIEGNARKSWAKSGNFSKQRHIGMVFQDLALWPHMTVYGGIEFGLKAYWFVKRRGRKD